MSIQRIKKGDTVIVNIGVSRGKTGNVLHVFPNRGRAIVEGLNVVKKTMRKSQDNPHGGIGEKEASIGLSNMMLYCPDCKRGVRVTRVKDGDKSVRKCKGCGHLFGD